MYDHHWSHPRTCLLCTPLEWPSSNVCYCLVIPYYLLFNEIYTLVANSIWCSLLVQNQARNEAQETLDKERQTYMQCQSSLNLINQSREMRLAEISRVQCDIKVSTHMLLYMYSLTPMYRVTPTYLPATPKRWSVIKVLIRDHLLLPLLSNQPP